MNEDSLGNSGWRVAGTSPHGVLEQSRYRTTKRLLEHVGKVVKGVPQKWSNPHSDGTLVEDVVIGDYRRPWNARPEARHLAPGIPLALHWAHDPGGLEQIGCVYTAQGFEFDYVGVIFGPDLVYDFDAATWVGHPENSHDSSVKRKKSDFIAFARNTYRVLLSRGLKGCYVTSWTKGPSAFSEAE